MPAASLASQLPLAELRELAAELLGRGLSADQVLDQVVELADHLVDWRQVIRGPAGVAAVASDGPLLRAILRVVVASVRRQLS